MTEQEQQKPEKLARSVQKLKTMIEGFDEISHGGIPVGRTTLVSGTSGTGKTLLAIQFLYNGIQQFDEPGVFVTFEESPADIIINAYSFGWDLQALIEQGKLFILMPLPIQKGKKWWEILTFQHSLNEFSMRFVNIKQNGFRLILSLQFSNNMKGWV